MPSDFEPTSEATVLGDELLEALARHSDTRELSPELESVLALRQHHVYSDALWSLILVRYDADRARDYWRELLAHREELRHFLGRDVGLRVASIDYFVNIAGELGSPRIIHPGILEQLQSEATRDPLTGLGNRRIYREQLGIELSRAARYQTVFVIGVFDLDNFKSINDTYGHASGDRILRQTAQIISNSIRKTDLVTRWGGEEFVVLMPQTNLEGGREVAERIRRTLESELGAMGVTVSGGLASYPADGADEASLFAHADRALYRAKAEGKNRISAEPEERRRFPRLGRSFAVRLVPCDSRQPLDATTIDISRGGFSFTTDAPPAISSSATGTIDMDGHDVPFTGRAVYVEETSPGTYEVGLQFVEIPEATLAALSLLTTRRPEDSAWLGSPDQKVMDAAAG